MWHGGQIAVLFGWVQAGISVLLWAAVFAVGVPIAVLFTECCLALLGRRQVRLGTTAEPATGAIATSLSHAPVNLAVLVPAHDEELVIRDTLAALTPQIQPHQRLLVVADNCTDKTADIARSMGAEVIERFDAERRGKGYALDYGVQHLAATNPPDVVVIVDADCEVQPGAIATLAQTAIATQRPTQSIYLMEIPPNPSAKDTISALAIRVKNLVRSLGLAQINQPCLLGGTGMAFPWSAIQSVDLATGNIVEDMKLGLDLAIAGYSPKFTPSAAVVGRLPQQEAAATSQRTRWVHGHIQTLLSYGPRLFWEAFRQRRFDLFCLALELCVPPLSLLVMLWLGVTALALVGGLVGLSWLPALSAIAVGTLLVLAILIAWAGFARQDLPAKVLLAIPVYLLWKIPVYLKFVKGPESSWVRTARDTVDS